MTTLKRMEKTPTGWTCPRCGGGLDDDLQLTQSAACNCAGLDDTDAPETHDLGCERHASGPCTRRCHEVEDLEARIRTAKRAARISLTVLMDNVEALLRERAAHDKILEFIADMRESLPEVAPNRPHQGTAPERGE